MKAQTDVDVAAMALELAENRFKMDVEAQVRLLREANHEEGWHLDDRWIDHLAGKAPPWPVGRKAFRILRVRWGFGAEGVMRTFANHLQRVRRVHGEGRIDCWPMIAPGAARLRLLNGNDQHVPCLEWDVADLEPAEQGNFAHSVRGKSSLADELLVMMWMFPDLFRTMATPGLFAGGYEANVPEVEAGEWKHIPHISLDRSAGRLYLNGIHIDHPEWRINFGHAMPRLVS